MTALFLSRARLKPDQATTALLPILAPQGRLTSHVGKALMWSLFADRDDRKRDFLWRWDGERPGRLAGEFLILSGRPPVNSGLFELETRDFAPALSVGDRLAFKLRANPVIRRRVDGRPRTTKHDVVMHGLRDRLKGERAAPRQALLAEAGLAWMGRQLAEAGADLVADSLRVDGYQQHRISDGRGREIALSSLDFDGALLVTNPDRLLSRLASGFGSGRAYGFGLMLIRRA